MLGATVDAHHVGYYCWLLSIAIAGAAIVLATDRDKVQ
jgi:hypothetical protein